MANETALKFGPEWLRNLSHGNSTNAQPPFPNNSMSVTGTKYKLADYRYGREEMLALFDKNVSVPESVKDLGPIVAGKCQDPLALVPMSEDEQRMWARSVNSDALQRVAGKGPGPVTAVPRMRGGSVDRGRGRGRGGSFYQRGSSFDDVDGPPGMTLNRPRGFERSQSINEREDRDRRFDRNFSSRLEENGLIRKDITRVDDWRSSSREASDKQDEGGWRSVGPRDKWTSGSKGSWRSERDENDRDPLRDVSMRNGPSKGYSNRRSSQMWDDEAGGNQLPEWSRENDCDTEQLGTFDSAGAFLETKEKLKRSQSPEVKQRRTDEIEERAKENMVPNDVDHEEHLSGSARDTSQPSETKSKVTKSFTDRHVGEQTDKETMKNEKAFSQSSQQSKAALPPVRTKPQTSEASETARLSDTKPSDFSAIVTSNPSPVNDMVMTRAMMEAAKRHNTSDPNLGLAKSQVAVVNPVPKMIEPPLVQRPPLRPPTSEGKVWQKDKFPPEEDNFALLEKATENMMAQWTAEEEQRVGVNQGPIHPVDKVPALPIHHEEAYKWFYKDPQGEVQGPFTSTEMLEWFSAGYFTMDLLVRRGCDEKFTKLGELSESWGRVPFNVGTQPAPIRVPVPVPAPVPPLPHQILQTPQPGPMEADQAKLQQQLFLQQQLIQQQLLFKQHLHVQHVLSQLKQQESFTSLSQQQQHQILLQHLIAEQQLQRAPAGLGEVPGLPDLLTQLQLPLLGMTLPSLVKNDTPPMWGLPPPTARGHWPMAAPMVSQKAAVSGSIWDLDGPTEGDLPARQKSERDRREQEEEEERRKQMVLEEQRRRLAEQEEQRRQEEEMQRRRMEEEMRKLEELKRIEEEQKRQEELLRKEEEEQQRKVEERLKEIAHQEEMRKQEELRRQQEELRRKQEDEIRRKRQQEDEEELRQKREEEQLVRLEQQRKAAEEKRRKEEDQRQKELERQQRLEREKQLHMEQQAELERKLKLQAEMERQQKQQETLRRLHEQRAKAALPPWATTNAEKVEEPTLSLAQIQQIEKEHAMANEAEKARILQLEKSNQALQMVRAQQAKSNNLTWATKPSEPATVKTLMEIQLEEAERATHEEKQQPKPTPVMTSGPTVWNNAASNLTWASSANGSGWSSGLANEHVPKGFWDDVISQPTPQPTKSAKSGGESAFPALAKPAAEPSQSSSGVANKAKNIRAQKEEETVIKLFETHTLKNSDEFTQWCTKAMSNMASSVDVPTFIAFLKDVECPYELNDYVRSYLGESKECREFAKQFLERRSKYKNQTKQASAEENMWGPAPAITPSLNKSHNEFENLGLGGQVGVGNGNKSKKKKPKRMQKLDVSMLGFTVQSAPDRINIGEIDRITGN